MTFFNQQKEKAFIQTIYRKAKPVHICNPLRAKTTLFHFMPSESDPIDDVFSEATYMQSRKGQVYICL